jgi:hypothetical protein
MMETKKLSAQLSNRRKGHLPAVHKVYAQTRSVNAIMAAAVIIWYIFKVQTPNHVKRSEIQILNQLVQNFLEWRQQKGCIPEDDRSRQPQVEAVH